MSKSIFFVMTLLFSALSLSDANASSCSVVIAGAKVEINEKIAEINDAYIARDGYHASKLPMIKLADVKNVLASDLREKMGIRDRRSEKSVATGILDAALTIVQSSSRIGPRVALGMARIANLGKIDITIDRSSVLSGYDLGEARVIAKDPTVQKVLRAYGIKKALITMVSHPKERMGYSSATTQVSVEIQDSNIGAMNGRLETIYVTTNPGGGYFVRY